MRVPGWHDQTRAFEEAGKVRTVGLIQEQHPDRCALFMQWKEMDFPVMVDALNLLGVRVVPITVFIDEAGVVRTVNPGPGELEAFANAEFAVGEAENAEGAEGDAESRDDANRLNESRIGDLGDSLDPVRRKATTAAIASLTRPEFSDIAIALYGSVLSNDEDDAASHFRRGVVYRMRYDSPDGRPGDFAKAIEHWSRALELNPNQYIWRRRIQQYGPRLDKPYSFYDWVNTAREEIRARGEEPVGLAVEPSGAEFAQPVRGDAGDDGEARGPANPDPRGRIERDERGLIEVDAVVVATTSDRTGPAYRVHVLMQPNERLKAHWNNETAPAEVWLDPPEGWSSDRRLLRSAMPADRAVSDEERTVEFEFRPNENGDRPARIPGYALYYVCEGAEGTCLYLRQDFQIEIEK